MPSEITKQLVEMGMLGKEALDAPAGGDNNPNTPAANEGGDLNPAQALSWYNKNFGTTYGSVEEMQAAQQQRQQQEQERELTDEEKENARKLRQNNIYSFGLTNNLVNSEDLTHYAIDSNKSKKEVAVGLFKAHRIEELKGEGVKPEAYPTDTELESEFDSIYHQFEGSPAAAMKAGTRMYERMVDDWMQETYGNVMSLEKEFDASELSKKDRATYDQMVSTAKDLVPKELTLKVGDEEYPFKVTDDLIKKAAAAYGTDEQFATLRSTVTKPDVFAKTMENYIMQEAIPLIVSEVAKSHHTRMVKKAGTDRRAAGDDISLAGTPNGGAGGGGSYISQQPYMRK